VFLWERVRVGVGVGVGCAQTGAATAPGAGGLDGELGRCLGRVVDVICQGLSVRLVSRIGKDL
jgi:hypothetical protein